MYFHQFWSVVHKLFTFYPFSLKPLGKMYINLANVLLWCSSIFYLIFVAFGNSTWLLDVNYADWLKFLISYSQKLFWKDILLYITLFAVCVDRRWSPPKDNVGTYIINYGAEQKRFVWIGFLFKYSHEE